MTTADLIPAPPAPGTDLVPDGWWETVVVPWADEQTDERDLQDAAAHVAGMQAAYEQIGADTLELTRARRIIEIRWGELLGPARVGRPRADEESSQASDLLAPDDRMRFRKLAAARERLVDVMRDTDDPDKLTRSALLRIAASPEVEPGEPPASPGLAAVPDAEIDESPEARVDRKTQRAREALATQIGRASVAAEAAHDAIDDALGTDPPVGQVTAWRDEVARARKFLSSVSNRLTRRTHDGAEDGDAA